MKVDSPAESGRPEPVGEKKGILRFFFWPSIGLALAVVFLISDALSGRKTLTFYMFVLGQCGALFWALCFPVISALGRRFPLHPNRLLGASLLHMGLALVYGVIYIFILAGVMSLFETYLLGWRQPFQSHFSISSNYFYFPAVLFYWVALAFQQARHWFAAYGESLRIQAETRGQLERAQLDALRFQLQPHFLFNSFNTIISLIRTRESQAAVRALENLGDLLRGTLDNQPEVPLATELETLSCYLKLEKARFESGLDFRLTVQPDTLKLIVPHLLIQPLVENAVRHGIEAHPDAGLIQLDIFRDDQNLQIRLENEGPPFQDRQSFHRPGGLGLENVKLRLAAAFGNQAEFNIEPRSGGGAVVSLGIPLSTMKEAS